MTTQAKGIVFGIIVSLPVWLILVVFYLYLAGVIPW